MTAARAIGSVARAVTNWPALDVAIGLSFTFGLLALVCTSINEAIASVFNLRAKTLEKWIGTVLSDPSELSALDAKVQRTLAKAGIPAEATGGIAAELGKAQVDVALLEEKVGGAAREVGMHASKAAGLVQELLSARHTPTKDEVQRQADAFYAHPAIRPMVKPPRRADKAWHQGRRPSYIPAERFATYVLRTASGGNDPTSVPLAQTIASLPSVVRSAAVGAAQSDTPVLPVRAGKAGAVEDDVHEKLVELRARIETWFDESMDRLSGWYKRRVQLILAIVAVLAAVALNADTIRIAESLWSDSTLRGTIVASAGKYTYTPNDPTGVQQALDNVNGLKLPIGWTKTDTTATVDAAGKVTRSSKDAWALPGSFSSWVSKLLGLAITVFALMLGAPFWFDWLNKFVQIRGSGAKPAEKKKEEKPASA